MRQRRIKDIDKKIEVYSALITENPKSLRGKWREAFGRDGDLFIEIGCGKGQFISGLAERKPEGLFVAAEGMPSVVYRALSKVDEAGLRNVRFIMEYINDLGEYFADGELSGIYMNFSDPWPKKRNFKRRLTYAGRMKQYAKSICSGGFIEFKTDNDELFDFTLEQIEICREECGLEIESVTRDLHNSAFDAENIRTEYEEKFAAAGKTINRVRLVKKEEENE